MTQQLSILFAGNDQAVQAEISRYIQQANLPYLFQVVGSKNELQDRLKDQRVDVILLNHPLSNVSAEEIMPLASGTPVILLIRAGNEETAVHAMQAQAMDFLIQDSKGNYLVLLPLTIQNAFLRQRHSDYLLKVRKMKAITSLAGGIAHQFNNKLVGISGNLELMEIALPNNPAVEKYGGRIKNAISQISQLTEQLLAYSRQGKYHPKKMPLNVFVKDTLALIQSLSKPSIQLEVTLSEKDIFVEIDYPQMQMVLKAVVNNAVEAIMDKGVIRVATGSLIAKTPEGVERTPWNKGLHAFITVQDSGKGMDSETMERIFEPFFTTNFQGRGLGMAAAYGITAHHNGWITVNSKKGSGSSISIFLPAHSSIETTPTSTRKGEKPMRVVLIIDDEEIVIDVGTEMLKRMGYKVFVARTGKEAIDFVGSHNGPIDLALLDIGLPDMSGEEIYPCLMRIRPDLKVVVCSGYSLEGKAEQILQAGAQDFIQKPFAYSVMSEKLESLFQAEASTIL